MDTRYQKGRRKNNTKKMMKSLILFVLSIVLLFAGSCNHTTTQKKKKKKVVEKSFEYVPYSYSEVKRIFGEEYINDLYGEMSATLEKGRPYILNNSGFYNYSVEDLDYFFIDTILLLNPNKKELSAFLIIQSNPNKSSRSASIKFLKGRKFKSNWRFWGSGWMGFGTNNSYDTIHKHCLKLSDNYLVRDKKTGKIIVNPNLVVEKKSHKSDEFPKETFEQYWTYKRGGLGVDCFEDKSVFELFRPEDFVFTYNKVKKTLKVSCPVRLCDGYPPSTAEWKDSRDYDSITGEKIYRAYRYSDYISESATTFSYTFENVPFNGKFSFWMRYGFVTSLLKNRFGASAYYTFKIKEGKLSFTGVEPDLVYIKRCFPDKKKEYQAFVSTYKQAIRKRLKAGYGRNVVIKSIVE
jgi:hypothetical protein